MHAAALGSKLLKNAPVQVLCNWKLAFCQRQTINQFCITRSARLRCHRRGNWTTFPSAKAKVGNLQFPRLRQVIATKCVVTSVFTLQLCMLQFIVANKCTSNSDLIQEHNHDFRKFENPWNDIFWVINQKKLLFAENTFLMNMFQCSLILFCLFLITGDSSGTSGVNCMN